MATAVLRTVYGAELLERFAYYGSVFLIPNFMTVGLGASQSSANIAINCVFALSPLSALVAFFPADGRVGKGRVMVVGLMLYTTGLLLLTVAALPAVDPSPGHPKPMAWVFLAAGIAFLSVGYGFFKTVSAPIVADALDHGMVPALDRSKAFMLYSWIVNVGALAGTLISPFVRGLSDDTAPDPEDDSRTISSAFYLSFGLCALMGFTGLMVVMTMLKVLGKVARPRSERAENVFVEIRALLCQASSQHRQTIDACRVFAVLPMFWLVQNQFMSNVMFQLQWTNLPQSIPPEFFNNINTIAMLVTLVLLRSAVGRWQFMPSQKPRMLMGFAVVALSIVYCLIAQLEIEARGYFTVTDDYVLRQKQTALSAWVLVPPYVGSGIASALIEPTTLEAAFQRAPCTHKSLVMALYLLAASMSGWLGIAFAPLATPQTLKVMYGVMCTILSGSALAWCASKFEDSDDCSGSDRSLPEVAES